MAIVGTEVLIDHLADGQSVVPGRSHGDLLGLEALVVLLLADDAGEGETAAGEYRDTRRGVAPRIQLAELSHEASLPRLPSDASASERSGVVGRWRVDSSAGSEPDYRFTLANERTFLAWVRTSLGLLAAGVAVRQLVEPFGIEGGRTTLALLAIGASVVLVVGSYLRWITVQQAVRRGEPLPPARLVPVVAAGIVVLAVVAFVMVAFG